MHRLAAPRFIPIEGTELPRLPGVAVTRAPRSVRRLTLTLHLPSRTPEQHVLEDVVVGIFEGLQAPLTRREFITHFGASPAHIAAVRKFARKHRFRVSAVSPARRMLHLTGPTTALAKAFNVTRIRCRVGDTRWDSYEGKIWLPIELAGAVNGVYGFDARPEATRGAGADATAGPADITKSYSATEIANLYGFPDRDGRGQSVGVIALGGGYRESDMRHYFKSMQLPKPACRAISVCGRSTAK
jgi:hypothetical protein